MAHSQSSRVGVGVGGGFGGVSEVASRLDREGGRGEQAAGGEDGGESCSGGGISRKEAGRWPGRVGRGRAAQKRCTLDGNGFGGFFGRDGEEVGAEPDGGEGGERAVTAAGARLTRVIRAKREAAPGAEEDREQLAELDRVGEESCGTGEGEDDGEARGGPEARGEAGGGDGWRGWWWLPGCAMGTREGGSGDEREEGDGGDDANAPGAGGGG